MSEFCTQITQCGWCNPYCIERIKMSTLKKLEKDWWSMSVLTKGMEMPGCDANNENHGKAIPVHNGDRKPRETGIVGHEKLLEILGRIYPEELAVELFEKLMGSTNYGDKVRYDEAMNAVANIVNAPTVIPADMAMKKE